MNSILSLQCLKEKEITYENSKKTLDIGKNKSKNRIVKFSNDTIISFLLLKYKYTYSYKLNSCVLKACVNRTYDRTEFSLYFLLHSLCFLNN